MIALDKQAHFWAGAAIAATVALYTANPMLAIASTVAVAAVKEVLDRAGYGKPDIKDFIATAAGSAVVFPLLLG